MLQQTTVAAVTPRWERFLARFPTVEALSRAPEKSVLAEWSGLGYYARARHLHRAARRIAERGSFPRTAEGLHALPGIGAYTAAAVASIAFGERVAAVDGNVARVLARLLAWRVDARSPRNLSTLRRLAGELLPARHPGEHNQALMELGATVCTPRAPRCPACPLRTLCRAAALGTPERFPTPPHPTAPQRLRLAAGVAFRGGRLVLVPDTTLVRGHLTVPLFAVGAGADPAAAFRAAWPRLAGRAVRSIAPLGALRHSVLDRRYEVAVFRVLERGAARGPVRLVAPERLDEEPRGGLLNKMAARGWMGV